MRKNPIDSLQDISKYTVVFFNFSRIWVKDLKKRSVIVFISFLIVSLTSNVFAQVLSYDKNIEIKEGKKITTVEVQLNISNKEKNYLSNVKINHSEQDKFDLIEALIFDKQGSLVRKLKKKDVQTSHDTSYDTFFQDNLIESFNLHWNQYPYSIKYKYKIIEKEFLFIAKWFSVLYSKIPTFKSSLKVKIPKDYEFNLHFHDSLNFERTEDEKETILLWESINPELPKKEYFGLPFENQLEMVTIAPLSFKYDVKGMQNSWSSLGGWFEELNKNSEEITFEEKQVVDKLLRGVEKEIEKIKILYHYLQDNTRYINVDLEYGGLKSYLASYVCINKYGDCKALTTYMKALLTYIGIKSHYTLVSAGINKGYINENIPSQQFNHVILYIPLKGEDVWLENTSSSSPFNYLGTFTQNRLSLKIDGFESKLIRIPKLELKDVEETKSYNIDLNQKGTGKFKMIKRSRGIEFEEMVALKKLNNEIYLNNFIKDKIKLKKTTVEDWSFNHISRDSSFIELEIIGNCSDQFREIGNSLVLTPVNFILPEISTPGKRKSPISIKYPINKVIEVNYNLPYYKNHDINLPEEVYYETNFGLYTANYKIIDNSIKIIKKFQLNSNDFSLDNYQEFYNFFENINNKEKESLILISTKK